MKILIIKMSSMGDIIHTLPALSDAALHISNLSCDWVVEEQFAEIPSWHVKVKQVIPIGWRRWRKNLLKRHTLQELYAFYQHLRSNEYDIVIDCQGLIKSALVALCARGISHGFHYRAAREQLASLCYQQQHLVSAQQHAITKIRLLFAKIFQYNYDNKPAAYGFQPGIFEPYNMVKNYIVLLHGTSWPNKQWPQEHWASLANTAIKAGFNVIVPYYDANDYHTPRYIINNCPSTDKLQISKMHDLQSIARIIYHARAVIAVDTGLAHLASAFNVPTVALYGPTNPTYSGISGTTQDIITADFACAPCMRRTCKFHDDFKLQSACLLTISPAQVWLRLRSLLDQQASCCLSN